MAVDPGGTRESLVARRQRRVRRDLATAAIQLFVAKGYQATTVEEIADAVEISPSTFYRHFPTKSDVVLEFSRSQLRMLGESFAARPADEPVSVSLAAAVEGLAADLGTSTSSLKNLEELLADNIELRCRLFGDLDTEIRTVAAQVAPRLGFRPTDLRTEVVATAIASTFRVALERWARDGGEESPFQALQTAFGLLAPLFDDVAAPPSAPKRKRIGTRPAPQPPT